MVVFDFSIQSVTGLATPSKATVTYLIESDVRVESLSGEAPSSTRAEDKKLVVVRAESPGQRGKAAIKRTAVVPENSCESNEKQLAKQFSSHEPRHLHPIILTLYS